MTLSNVIDHVADTISPETSVHALVSGLADHIDAHAGDPAHMTALVLWLRQNKVAIGQAVVAKSPLDPIHVARLQADNARFHPTSVPVEVADHRQAYARTPRGGFERDRSTYDEIVTAEAAVPRDDRQVIVPSAIA